MIAIATSWITLMMYPSHRFGAIRYSNASTTPMFTAEAAVTSSADTSMRTSRVIT